MKSRQITLTIRSAKALTEWDEIQPLRILAEDGQRILICHEPIGEVSEIDILACCGRETLRPEWQAKHCLPVNGNLTFSLSSNRLIIFATCERTQK